MAPYLHYVFTAPCRASPASEHQLAADLDDARFAEGADLSEGAASDIRAGKSVRVAQVQRVVSFAAKLQLDGLMPGQAEVLHQGNIQVPETRAAQRAAAGIAGPHRTLRNRLEASRVEPGRLAGAGESGVCLRRSEVRTANHIRARAGCARSQQAETGGIGVRCGDREGRACVETGDTRQLPSAQSVPHGAMVAFEEREVIDVIQAQHLGAVERGRAIFAFMPVVAALRRVGSVGGVVGEVLGPGVSPRK